MNLFYPPYSAPTLPAPTAFNQQEAPARASEMVPVIETNGLVIGQASRTYVHSGSKLLHPVVHLHIINRNCELYLQKRSMNKDLLPGYWDTAVGGHVDYGEQIVEALFREAYEELRLRDFNQINLLSYEFESETEKELVNVFACVGNFNISPSEDEIEEGRFWTFQQIEENLGKGVFTPNFEGEFRRIRSSLESLL